MVKNPPASAEDCVRSLGQEDALEKEMAPTPVFLLGNATDRADWWGTDHGVAKSQRDLAFV